MQERFTVRILREIAEELGLRAVVEPDFGHVGYMEHISGKRFFFKLSALDVNFLGASKIATDKAYTQFFLQKFGYPTIPTHVVFSDEWCLVNNTKNNATAALASLTERDYPRIVKPNSKSQGRGVFKVHTPTELREAFQSIFMIDNIALVQPCIPGTDYRIVVYRDQIIAAYSRTAPHVAGDGVHTIAELITSPTIPWDTVTERLMRLHQLRPESILEAGRELTLLDNANLSTGGRAEDVTDKLHPSIRKLAVDIVHQMNLTFAGLDLLTTDTIHEPVVNYVIVEVNAMPGLEHYAALGPDAALRVRALYRRILNDYFTQ